MLNFTLPEAMGGSRVKGIEFQITSIIVLVILASNYVRNRKLPRMSSKIFSFILACGIVNIVADVGAVYVLRHIESIPLVKVRGWHQIFAASLITVVFSVYLYVGSIMDMRSHFWSKANFSKNIPYILALGLIGILPIYYYTDSYSVYSYGPMIQCVYVIVILYIVLIFMMLFGRGNKFFKKMSWLKLDECGKFKKGEDTAVSKETKWSISCGIMVWIMIAIYQSMNPSNLLSSVGVSMMILFIYLSLENPKEFLDVESNTLNRRAFHIMVPEMVRSSKNFYVISYVIDDLNYIPNLLGYEETRKVLAYIGENIKHITNARIYHSRTNTLTIFIKNKKNVEELIKKSSEWKLEYIGANNISLSLKYHINVIEYPTYAGTIDEIYDVMDYMATHFDATDENKIVYADEELIKRKNHYLSVQALVEKEIKNKDFEVYYQPIYSTKAKKFTSAEALVRLRDKETLGYISPEIFIPIAEQKGLIKELGNIVFEKVCTFASQKKLWEYGVEYIEVNLSSIEAIDKRIVTQLRECMEKHQVKPKFINLEITETASTEGGDMMHINMNQLRELGCHFSMDDFGTGYSNLAQMIKVRFEMIKLDKSLLWPCFEEDGTEAKVLLENCINMIHQLGMKIVAEGVETQEQAECLIEKGVNYLQGYYFSKPVCEEDYINILLQNEFNRKMMVIKQY